MPILQLTACCLLQGLQPLRLLGTAATCFSFKSACQHQHCQAQALCMPQSVACLWLHGESSTKHAEHVPILGVVHVPAWSWLPSCGIRQALPACTCEHSLLQGKAPFQHQFKSACPLLQAIFASDKPSSRHLSVCRHSALPSACPLLQGNYSNENAERVGNLVIVKALNEMARYEMALDRGGMLPDTDPEALLDLLAFDTNHDRVSLSSMNKRGQKQNLPPAAGQAQTHLWGMSNSDTAQMEDAAQR